MIGTAWTRARNGHPTVVLGSTGPPPDDLHIVTGRLDRGESGLVRLARVLATTTRPPVDVFEQSLPDRLLFGSAPFDRPAPMFADSNTVGCLSGAEGASNDVLDLVARWLTADRCAIVFLATESCPLSLRIRRTFGDAAVLEGQPGPVPGRRTVEQTLLLLIALAHDGHVTPAAWAEAAATTPLAALATLETLRHTLPIEATRTGYQVDPAWIQQQAETLGPAARTQLPSTPVTQPLSSIEAHALGWFTLASDRASSPLERAAIAWSAGTLPPFDDALPALAKVHLAWEHDAPSPFDRAALELPAEAHTICRALADARWRSPSPVDDPAATALLASLSDEVPREESLRALGELLDAEAVPARRGRLLAHSGRLAAKLNKTGEATLSLGEALPLLHEAGDGVVLAEVVETLAGLLEAEAVGSLVGWLEAAVIANNTHPEGLAACARALGMLDQAADATEDEGTLRRLGLQIDSLQRGTPRMQRV